MTILLDSYDLGETCPGRLRAWFNQGMYVCLDCEVAWSRSVGPTCWCCQGEGFIRPRLPWELS